MKTQYIAAQFALGLILGLGVSIAFADNNDRSERQQRDTHAEQRQHERSRDAEQRGENEPHRLSIERANQSEEVRHVNHLSADQRRALRQQINEAGQDIYARQH